MPESELHKSFSSRWQGLRLSWLPAHRIKLALFDFIHAALEILEWRTVCVLRQRSARATVELGASLSPKEKGLGVDLTQI
jgi:hypothetical protein